MMSTENLNEGMKYQPKPDGLHEDQISFLVDRVIKRLGGVIADAPISKEEVISPLKFVHKSGLFDSINDAVDAAIGAQQELIALSLEKRKEIIESIREASSAEVNTISKMAVQETGFGRVDDKIKKNLLVIHKTPGVEDVEPKVFTGDDGLTLQERAPFGVIGSVTPCTNPTETIICNSIGMIAAGNSVVFCPHPLAKEVSNKIIDIINRAIVESGGPHHLLTGIYEPSIEKAQELMRHPKIKLLVVTGGPGVVREAMGSGKRVIAAGPGNPPVVVDETADLEQAGRDIVLGASIDNNIVCTAEKEIFCVDSVATTLLEGMKKHGAYVVNPYQLKQLEKIVLVDTYPNKKFIGKNANVILKEIGVMVGDELRLIVAETSKDHLFVTREMMMPLIPLVRVKNVDEAIALAKKAEHGYHHSAVMHSKNIDHLHRMAKEIGTAIFVKNAPNTAGLGLEGEGFTSFTIASVTGEGLTSAKDFTKIRRCVLKDRFRIT